MISTEQRIFQRPVKRKLVTKINIMMQKIILLAPLAIFSLTGCSKDPNTDIAKCEQDFYKTTGAIPVEKASLEYLQQKGESVRTCMIAKGFKYNRGAAELNIKILKNVANQINIPITQNEIDRRKAINPTQANAWE